jgi:mannose-1-phosphate guanylyltransferase
MNGLVLSAGLGTRLRPYTETLPKPAIPFLTVPLACYPLSLFEDHKIHHLVVNTHHLPSQIENAFKKIHWPCEKLIFSPEPDQILGSGGGVRRALPSLLGRKVFFVANADEVLLPFHHAIIKEALAFHQHHGGIATVLCLPHPEVGTKFGGLWLPEGEESKVQCFSRAQVSGCRGLHYVGILLLSDRIQNYFFTDDSKEENILYDTLTKAMSLGEEVRAFSIPAQWFETGNPQDFGEASRACLAELQSATPAPWATYLAQVICRWSTGEFMIENDHHDLRSEMKRCLAKVQSGELKVF